MVNGMKAHDTTRPTTEKTTDHTDAYARLKATEGVHGKSLERARTEPMSFATPSKDLVIVANERHDNPENHTYGVVVDDGLPVHCTCPAEKRFPTPCKHRLAVSINEPVIMAAEASDDERAGAESEPVPIADGGSIHGREHADGCTDPHCEGLDGGADGRPELSFECWEVWSAESHDWSDERGDADTTPTADDATDLSVEQVVAMHESRGWI